MQFTTSKQSNFLAQILVILCFIIPLNYSECENGCSGHGKCTAYDMCLCYRNWQGNDCHEKICPFGTAFVDSPKGDLDSSTTLDGPDTVIGVNNFVYPYGTSEAFPNMVDSDLHILENTAHEYVECSNTGVCNRTNGTCECFDGFEGVACQRMKCPGLSSCNGHGICQSTRQIAYKDHKSLYQLWDKDFIRGCICDAGFYGGDCSLRKCPYGLDPLYLDDVTRIQFPFYFFTILTTSTTRDFSNGFAQSSRGYFNIKIYDLHDEAWYTEPIYVPATCEDIVTALENIPNKIIPKGMTTCIYGNITENDPLQPSNNGFSVSYYSLYRLQITGTRFYTMENYPAFSVGGFEGSYFSNNSSTDPRLTGDLYQLQFYGNVGGYRQPEINIYLDGNRPTLQSLNGELITKVWTNGQQGVNVDYFPNHCQNMQVRLAITPSGDYLLDLINYNPNVLKRCLGGSDFDPNNNVWDSPLGFYGTTYDHGNLSNPHLIKLSRSTTDYKDGGFLVALIYDPTITYTFPSLLKCEGCFRLLHPFHSLDNLNVGDTRYEVFTTNGVLLEVGTNASALFDFASNVVYTVNASSTTQYDTILGEVSCEGIGISGNVPSEEKICLDKNDLFLLIDPYHIHHNPAFLNMYQALSVQQAYNYTIEVIPDEAEINPISFKYRPIRNIIVTDINTNWAQDAVGHGAATIHIYKFFPVMNSSYVYVNECSNRGLCNTFEGICDCFPGYSGQACELQELLTS